MSIGHRLPAAASLSEIVWWLAEQTLAGRDVTAKQIQTNFACSRATAYRWRRWLRDKRQMIQLRARA